MKKTTIIITAAIIVTIAACGIAFAQPEPWTYDQSPYERLSPEWIADVQTHVNAVITNPDLTFEERAERQAYILGWDKRFEYIEKYGTIEDDTITYDVPFFEFLNQDGWITSVEEYQTLQSIYDENYFYAVREVPKVIA